MNSKSNKVTWQTMSNEPSLSSIESGFVSLTGSKAKETVNGRNDLNMEKNKDIKIFVENARNAMKDAQKEKKSNFQVFFSNYRYKIVD
ncbi:unnamed protein product [Meloidogyne enterolobii]|uniref:Uncharacterized protein n=1 Tax=Meloidogyne enterolobii TaxID=390850 RepID=A0ACB1AV72_MELEN